MHAFSVSLAARPVLRGRSCVSRVSRSQKTVTRSRQSHTLVVAGTKNTVFIDGEAGTTGLQVRDRLSKRTDIEIISLFGDARKDTAKRAEMLNKCDVAILCLPDDAAIEAVSLVTNGTGLSHLPRSASLITAPDGRCAVHPKRCSAADYLTVLEPVTVLRCEKQS